jgi:hypothetical protein
MFSKQAVLYALQELQTFKPRIIGTWCPLITQLAMGQVFLRIPEKYFENLYEKTAP